MATSLRGPSKRFFNRIARPPELPFRRSERQIPRLEFVTGKRITHDRVERAENTTDRLTERGL
ncbi:MAG: hypothetical protein J07HX5_00969 [halophilic archaeon J07HX5]|nr:MAG: hypothetical protein J07HX5_00969 [halophilic archaeon J07HX5]